MMQLNQIMQQLNLINRERKIMGYYTDCYKPTTRSRTQKVKNTPSKKKHSKGHEQKKRLRGEKNGI